MFRATVNRILVPVGLAALLALLVVAAPALSLEPYRPAPVDFEISAPSGATGVKASRAGRGYVSAPIKAPKRFDLLGMRWRGAAEPAIAVRVRASGGRWGRWTPVPAHSDHNPDPGTGERASTGMSDAVWAGTSDELQYRLSRPLPDLRLHFVNATGSTSPARRAVTAIRGLANRAILAVATPTSAFAAGARPTIVPRSAWGAQYCTPRRAAAYGAVRMAFIHHTVTANSYSPAQAPAAVLAICRYHRNSNGWNDIGYNFLVDRYGKIYEGRAGGLDRPVIGAQAEGWNANSTGISNIGTFSSVPQSRTAIAAMARVIRWKLPISGTPTSGTVRIASAGGSTTKLKRGTIGTFSRISGHRDGNNTSCPGTRLYGQLPGLRIRVGRLGPSAPPPPAPTGGGADPVIGGQ